MRWFNYNTPEYKYDVNLLEQLQKFVEMSLLHVFLIFNFCFYFLTGQYKQNICNATDTNCQLCSNRLPTCVGESDGNHAFPSKLWQRDFIICYKNRTVSIAECEDGLYFNPRTEQCQKSVDIGRSSII